MTTNKTTSNPYQSNPYASNGGIAGVTGVTGVAGVGINQTTLAQQIAANKYAAAKAAAAATAKAQNAANARYQAAADYYTNKAGADATATTVIRPDRYRGNPINLESISAMATASFERATGVPGRLERGYIRTNRFLVPGGDSRYTFKEGNIKYAWEFNFLYNPAEYATSTATNWDLPMIQSIANDSAPVLSPTGSSVTFSLFFNRVDDNMRNWSTISSQVPAWPSPASSKGKKTGSQQSMSLRDLYKRQGTNADIEFLYRVVNGNPVQTVTRGITSDWGQMLPVMVDVSLSAKAGTKYTGYISSLNVNHVMFNPDMVPIISQADITLTRLMDIAGKSRNFSFQYDSTFGTTTDATTPAGG